MSVEERTIYLYNDCNDCIGTIDFNETQWKYVQEIRTTIDTLKRELEEKEKEKEIALVTINLERGKDYRRILELESANEELRRENEIALVTINLDRGKDL
jgi:hypothetical protein